MTAGCRDLPLRDVPEPQVRLIWMGGSDGRSSPMPPHPTMTRASERPKAEYPTVHQWGSSIWKISARSRNRSASHTARKVAAMNRVETAAIVGSV